MASIAVKRRWFFGLWGAFAAAVVAVAHEVLLPFVLALVVAYVFTPAVRWVETKKVPRAGAIVLVYVVLLTSIGGFVRLIAPRLGSELVGLRNEVPTLAKQVQDVWVPKAQTQLKDWGLSKGHDEPVMAKAKEPQIVATPRQDGTIAIEVKSGIRVQTTRTGFVVEPGQEEAAHGFDANRMLSETVAKSMDYARTNFVELARVGQAIVRGVSRALFVFTLTLMLGAYIMLTREKVLGFFRSLVRPQDRASYEALLARIDRGLSGVVRGQLVICLVNGVLTAIGFAFVGLKYWPVLALIATVASLIPIFGAIVSSIPAVFLGLTQGVGTATFVLAWIVGIHQLEANFLNPKIIGDAAKIHPVLVVFSLLVGEHLFHIMGALLAVPCMSIAQSLFNHFRAQLQEADPDFEGEPPVLSIRPPAP